MKSQMVIPWLLTGTVLLAGNLFVNSVAAQETVSPRKKLLDTAISDAVNRLEKRDYYGFIEYYFPIEELVEIRRNERYVETIADMVRDRERTKAMITALKTMQGLTPKFEKDETIARFKVEQNPEELPVLAATQPERPTFKITSYEGELDTVIKTALADLESEETNRISRALRSLLPVSELNFQFQSGQFTQTLGLLGTEGQGETEEAGRYQRFDPRAAARKAMIDDLKAVSELEPVLTEDPQGTLAAFKLEGKTITLKGNRFQDPKTIKLPDRTIMFQQTEQGWRFRDQSSAEIAEWEKLQTARQTGPLTTNFVWERFGDSWRLSNERE